MLPHRTDAYEHQPIQYPPGSPPTIPQVQVPPEVYPYLADIAVVIANEAAGRSNQSPLRMFCFNMLAANNWLNPDFADVVSMAAFTIALDLRKGMAQDPRQILTTAATDTYVLWISEKLHQFPELKSMVTPQLINATMENLGFLNAKRQEIANFKNQLGMGGFAPPSYPQPSYPQQGYPQQGYPQQQYPQPGYGVPTMGAPQYPGTPSFGQTMRAQPMGMGYPPAYPPPQQGAVNKFTSQNAPPMATQYPSTQYGPPPVQQTVPSTPATLGRSGGNGVTASSYYENNYTRYMSVDAEPEVALQEASTDTSATAYTKADWIPTSSQPYRTLINRASFDVYYQKRQDRIYEVVKPLEKPHMNRNLHAITFLDHSYTLDGVLRNEQITNASRDMATISRENLEAAISTDGTEPEVENLDLINTYIDKNWGVGSFLEDAIFRVKLMCRKHQQTKGACGVYRSFVTIAKPIVTDENYDNVYEQIFSMRRFTDMARKLRSIGTACTTKKDTDGEDATDLILYCNEIDNWLTSVINQFLVYNLSLGKVTIDSFTSDIDDLRNYLDQNYDGNYSAAYDRFELEMLGSRKISPLDKVLMADIKESFDIKEEEESRGANISFIPINYSLTYVDILASELAIDVSDVESLMIEERQTPMLYELASSLYTQVEAWPYMSVNNLIITRDDRIYRLHKGYLMSGSYLISK
jgi:hypothetical protein